MVTARRSSTFATSELGSLADSTAVLGLVGRTSRSGRDTPCIETKEAHPALDGFAS